MALVTDTAGAPMSEPDLVAIAQQAVGEADTVLAAAWMEPRGTSGGAMAGMEASDMASDMVGGGVAGAALGIAGTMIGFKKGRDSGGFASEAPEGTFTHRVPHVSLVAVSATNIYAWTVGHDGLHRRAGELLFALPREEVEINIRSRFSVRTFEVVHDTAAEKWEFEGARFGSHMKFVMAALHAD
jgi:hypothetical protein